MTRLLIDIGNTRLKWAWQTDDRLSPADAIVYQPENLANELAVIWQEYAKPQEIWLVSVARQEINDIVNGYLATQWNSKPRYVQSDRALLGVTNAYTEPQKLGCDRWLALVAAYQLEGRSVMVVDCGSAVTIDAVDDDGHHLGGVIAPGITLSNAALSRQTSLRWQPVTGLMPVKVLATSTAEGIAAGIGYSIIGLIEVAFRELVDTGHHPVIYLTGGDAAYISHALSIEHRQAEDLALQGLAMVANHA